ncbi:hypothetical protein D7V94_13475 [Parablautia intestinalis]|uniref:Rho termination factor N-terminal domain-containing protein n=1 Tax=Parablautia intestinalis TaxID=2320100 RepID=A0A3A9AGF7_9FIRM|nr:hypothetical protein [Parablautia intestinalis]RKI90439.1 hypothetical protein D7V94_13475 [Parablautia intestinalis]
MKIKNNSNKIVGMTGLSLLPGETAECPKGYENNPVIRKYITKGALAKVEDDVKTNEETRTVQEKDLQDMTKEELLAYAAEHNIDIGNATTEAGILKKIQDAQKA